jgi:ribose/xylose/arabinose/galactoside ABC-type transport system permease subunit
MTEPWKFLGAGYIAGIPTPVWTMFIVFIVCVLFLNRTRLGRHVYAVGGNATAAKFSGIDTFKVKFAVFTISGTLRLELEGGMETWASRRCIPEIRRRLKGKGASAC